MEVPGVAEEAGEVGGEQLDQMAAGVRVTVLRRAEQRVECVGPDEPVALSPEQLTVSIEKLEAGQSECQSPRSLELILRQHPGARIDVSRLEKLKSTSFRLQGRGRAGPSHFFLRRTSSSGADQG